VIFIKTQKKLASKILKCGKKKVWVDSNNREEIKKAITKVDVRRLIKKGYIKKKKTNEQSRARSIKNLRQKKLGRKKGPGKKKGKKQSGKKEWIKNIRAQRKYLKELRDIGKISKSQYRKLYLMAKGGRFRSKSHLTLYMKEMIKYEEKNTA